MINYTLFTDLWDTALKSNSREEYTALWSRYDLADTFTLDSVYDMAYGGVRRIRTVIGLSQISFAEQYQIPRRSLEAWETGTRVPPSYTVKMLGYSVLTDAATLRDEFDKLPEPVKARVAESRSTAE